MFFLFRGISRTIDYAPRWWRWTFRNPLRLAILVALIGGFAAVPAYDHGQTWAEPVELAGGFAIITVLSAARWFWAGTGVVSLRMKSDPFLRLEVTRLIDDVGLKAAIRSVGANYGRRRPPMH